MGCATEAEVWAHLIVLADEGVVVVLLAVWCGEEGEMWLLEG